jgi:hypothetical protein
LISRFTWEFGAPRSRASTGAPPSSLPASLAYPMPVVQPSRRALTGGQMTATHRLRIATTDVPGAAWSACATISGALGLPVVAEFQEIEGACLMLELRLGGNASLSAKPSLFSSIVSEAVPSVTVLSAWRQRDCPGPAPRYCQNVLARCFDVMPPVAERALRDDLATARWEYAQDKWHLAVPSLCTSQRIVGLSHRSGHSQRFTSHDVAAIQRGLPA